MKMTASGNIPGMPIQIRFGVEIKQIFSLLQDFHLFKPLDPDLP
jgi:hypothetical protein